MVMVVVDGGWCWVVVLGGGACPQVSILYFECAEFVEW